jgi:hypothetical protein
VIEMTDQGDLLDALLLETAGWLAIEDATGSSARCFATKPS